MQHLRKSKFQLCYFGTAHLVYGSSLYIVARQRSILQPRIFKFDALYLIKAQRKPDQHDNNKYDSRCDKSTVRYQVPNDFVDCTLIINFTIINFDCQIYKQSFNRTKCTPRTDTIDHIRYQLCFEWCNVIHRFFFSNSYLRIGRLINVFMTNFYSALHLQAEYVVHAISMLYCELNAGLIKLNILNGFVSDVCWYIN